MDLGRKKIASLELENGGLQKGCLKKKERKKKKETNRVPDLLEYVH